MIVTQTDLKICDYLENFDLLKYHFKSYMVISFGIVIYPNL